MPLPITDPARTFYSQRIDGRPFVNCLPYSICPVLRWMGYDVPDTYGMTIREASGVPMGEHRGTSFSDMKRALAKLLPDAPLSWASLSDAELINSLANPRRPNRRSVVSITARMEKMPRHLRRHCGYTWEGGHALTLHGRQKAPDGSWLVYLTDPMGRSWRGYKGEWAAWADIQPALSRNKDGLIRVCVGKRGSAA